MKYLFPLSFKIKMDKFWAFLLVLVLYVGIYCLLNWLLLLPSGFITLFGVLRSALGLYCLMGFITTILVKIGRL